MRTFGQITRNMQQSEQIMKMDEGVEMMNQGKFAAADTYFREALQNLEIVPADLCFYFGKNSYHLEKYSQSIDWLNKYIELKGTSGRYFDQAAEYLMLAEEDLQAVGSGSPASRMSGEAERKTSQRKILDCEEVPFVVCPECRGEGVKIERGALGSSIYKKCMVCKESGRLSCQDYKKYIRGQLVPADLDP
jgi:tetratricopeptide (TPR) repeat protein